MKKPEPFVFEGQTYYPERGSSAKYVGVCSDCAFDERIDCSGIPCGPHHYITVIQAVTKRLNPPPQPGLFGKKPSLMMWDDITDIRTQTALFNPFEKDPAP